VRSFALNSRKHLAIGSRYPRLAAIPDRWVSWCLRAIPAGLRIIGDNRIDVIFTTFPIASAVLIGLALHRLTGRPWIVDLRDPMTEDGYPSDPLDWRVLRWLERATFARASRILLTTEATCRMYRERYPALAGKFVVIPNGYDEADFEGLPETASTPAGPFRLLHSGLVYPQDRDPRPLFRAVARLRRERALGVGDLRLELRGSGFEDTYRSMVDELDLREMVQILPPLPYRDSLADAGRADALLLLQGPSCDGQIPAKLYEYLRLSRPILALTTQEGDSAALLRQTGGATVARIDDEEELVRELPRFIDRVRAGRHELADRGLVRSFSRRHQAGMLGACLDEVVG